MFVNPLDRVPQIPQDLANHIAYGGFLGIGLHWFGLSLLFAFYVVLFVATAKKTVDYFKENETLGMCIGKTFVTAIWPASIWLIN